MSNLKEQMDLEMEFLRSLPTDGTLRVLHADELEMGFNMNAAGLAFMVSGTWPTMMANITFNGRKVLSRAE